MRIDRFDVFVPRSGGVKGGGGVTPSGPEVQHDGRSRSGQGVEFERLLERELRQAEASGVGIRFSSHALDRLESRGIVFDSDALARLGHAFERLEAKGGRESLVLTDEAALLVSVPKRTVITAIDRMGAEDRVFTNIDSAVVL